MNYTTPSLRIKGETGACVRGEDYANENKKASFFFLEEENENGKYHRFHFMGWFSARLRHGSIHTKGTRKGNGTE
jgi:hypothetical protein